MGLLSTPLSVGTKVVRGLLDMSTPARMQRAEDMGFDTNNDWYHGTNNNISKFLKSMRGSGTQANSAKKAFWFTDDVDTTAKSYADYSATGSKVEALLQEANVAERAGNWDLYDDKLREAEELESFFMGANENRLQGQNLIPTKLPKEESLLVVDMKGARFHDGAFGEVNDSLDKAKAQGYKGVKFLNLDDAVGFSDKPATHVAIFEPQNIRSKFAEFDPAKADSGSLSASNPVATAAGLGGLGFGGAAALGSKKLYADGTPTSLLDVVNNASNSMQSGPSGIMDMIESEQYYENQYGTQLGVNPNQGLQSGPQLQNQDPNRWIPLKERGATIAEPYISSLLDGNNNTSQAAKNRRQNAVRGLLEWSPTEIVDMSKEGYDASLRGDSFEGGLLKTLSALELMSMGLAKPISKFVKGLL